MYGDPTDFGFDTDESLGLQDSTWSTGVGDLDDSAPDLGYDADPDGTLGEAPDLTAPDSAGATDPTTSAPAVSMPAEITFGAELGPYGQSNDSYREDINWSTESGTFIGAQTGREMDEWTGTAK